MKMKVPTSNIDYVDWHDGNMDMKFDNGKFVRYFDIPEGLAMGVVQAPSAGSFFNRYIKGIFRYVVTDEPGTPKTRPTVRNELFKKYEHEYESTRGLWCFDKNPKEVDIDWIRENAFQLT